jgi:subtilisin family serine protease
MKEATLRHFVFQTFGRARRTQDSPIMPDVWMRYIRLAEDIARAKIAGGKAPSCGLDLLLTPWSGTRPGEIASLLRARLSPEHQKTARIAQSTTRVVAHVEFLTLVNVIVPMTGWWQQLDPHFQVWDKVFAALPEKIDSNDELSQALSQFGADIEFFRYAALVGFIDRLIEAKSVREIKELEALARWLGAAQSGDESADDFGPDADDPHSIATPQGKPAVKDIKPLITGYDNAVGSEAAEDLRKLQRETGGVAVKGKQIFLINLNRPATQGLYESRGTVKADASQRLFEVTGAGLRFAVIDGGIDARHPAFLNRTSEAYKKEKEKEEKKEEVKEEEKCLDQDGLIPKARLTELSRVAATYDFTILRDIMACGGDKESAPARIAELIKKNETAFQHLTTRDQSARDLDWAIVEPLVKMPYNDSYIIPGSDHATHVAGIMAADLPEPADALNPIYGMSRELSLYDLRVFDLEGKGDEFAILCALEFTGWLNRDRSNPVIHGVNLSLALRHDVDSFACGQTPICEACNFLVGSGTVVVAAAGNTGFETAAQKQSLGNGYRQISITDPGNAEAVITVGSTHRRDPHAYGVSFFSGRGPTGDGRRKPDILAPGEKITSTIRGGRTQRMDGTSMAAPHVSGAAALLMARYPELIGRPLRIKEILMSTATDLKREPYFQGAGLLDVLRALQSV